MQNNSSRSSAAKTQCAHVKRIKNVKTRDFFLPDSARERKKKNIAGERGAGKFPPSQISRFARASFPFALVRLIRLQQQQQQQRDLRRRLWYLAKIRGLDAVRGSLSLSWISRGIWISRRFHLLRARGELSFYHPPVCICVCVLAHHEVANNALCFLRFFQLRYYIIFFFTHNPWLRSYIYVCAGIRGQIYSRLNFLLYGVAVLLQDDSKRWAYRCKKGSGSRGGRSGALVGG